MNEKEDWKEDMRKIIREEIPKAIPLSSEPTSEIPQGHKTLADWMECKNCNPSDQYPRVKKALLKVLGRKECKDCGNIDRKEEEYCEKCGEEYSKQEA